MPKNNQAPPDEVLDEAVDTAVDSGDIASSGAETPPPSWRDQAKEYGIDLSEHADDASAFKHLASQVQSLEAARREAETAKQLAQYGQEYLNYAPQFRSWFEEQQRAKQQEPPDPYSRPEYDPRWESMVEYDENGVLVPVSKNFGTPEIVSKVQAMLNWRRGFLNEPDKYLEKFISTKAQSIAEEQVKAAVQELRNEFAAQHFVLGNGDKWLYAKDENGEEVWEQDPASRRMVRKLSEEGELFRGDLEEAAAMGMNQQQQEAYAMKLRGIRRQTGGGTTKSGKAKSSAEKKSDFLKNAAGFGASPAASTQPPLRSTETSQNENMSLDQRLREALESAGITDSDVYANA